MLYYFGQKKIILFFVLLLVFGLGIELLKNVELMGKATIASREEVLKKAKVIIRIFEGLELKPYICKGGALPAEL